LKIISRYIVREHLGPFLFAFLALTSLMLLNFISRQFGELVGKGLPWQVIAEFFALSVPFTVALTVPMAVLVAALYAYSRLASENEVTAFKANGVSPWRLIMPALGVGVIMSALLLAFNDQILPRANHELKTLQEDISQTKPTFLLHEQVINTVAEGKFYLKAGQVDRAGSKLKDVVIYNLADPVRRRTIYAESGAIAMEPNGRDLDLDLYDGQMHEVSTDKPTQLNRLFFKQQRIRIKDVGKGLTLHSADDSNKGDREMGICEMQQRLWAADFQYAIAQHDFGAAQRREAIRTAPPKLGKPPEPKGLGWAYCRMIHLFDAKVLHAAELRDAGLHLTVVADTDPRPVIPAAQVQDTTLKPAVKPPDSAAKPIFAPAQQPVPPTPQIAVPAVPPAAGESQEAIAARAAMEVMKKIQASQQPPANDTMLLPRANQQEAKIRLEIAQRGRDRYEIEINKKFSLAAACLIFCIVAPPIALRFPRGGVGLVIGVSLAVFALYYVGLIGGEALANKGIVPPFWAMWATNVIMTLIGIVMLFRIRSDRGSSRGGGLRDWLDERRYRKEARRAARGRPA
jgi:lipopolysaccharide export system permease protein